MKICKPCPLIAILLLACSASFCQEAKIVALTKYTQNEGLSSYYVTKIIKDSYGFMWVGTQEGLNLFDGRSFRVFSRQSESSNRLGGSFVIDMTEDKKRNLLWVLTAYGDICAIDLTTRVIRKRIQTDKDNQPLSGKWVRSITVQNDILWIGGLGVLSGFDISRNAFITTDALKRTGMSAGDCNVSKMVTDPAGRLWIFSEGYGISVLDKHIEHVKSYLPNNPNGSANRKLRFWDIAFNKQRMFVGTSRGLWTFDTGTPSVTRIQDTHHAIIDTAEILSLVFSSSDKLFFSTPNSFYSYDLSSRHAERYHDENTEDDWLTLTYQIFYDSTLSKIWVGTQSGLGSFEVKKTPFNAFSRSTSSTTRIKHAFSLLPVSEQEVYCGDENGVFHINTINKEIEKIDQGSSNLLLFQNAGGNIFVSNKSGFYLLKDKKLRPARLTFPSLAPLETDQMNCALQYNDSIVLFGSVVQKGLSVWNMHTGKLTVYHNDSARNTIRGLRIINNLYKSNSGEAFILTESAIIRFNPLTGASAIHTVRQSSSVSSVSNFMDMCETADGYWIGTYGEGVILTDKNFKYLKTIGVTQGLSNNCVYKIFLYKDRSLIATTNNGLSIIDCKTSSVQKYYKSDGLHSSFFEQVCGYVYNGKIYAGGVNGFTVIDPSILFSNPDPPVFYLNTLTIQTKRGTTDTTNIFLDRLTIPNDILQVTVSFSALNYKNSLRTSYSYKISEDMGDWIELGTQNFINLPVLPPGNHTLLFRSANEAGIWNQKPVTLILEYLPKWYQTIWFRLLIAAGIAGMFYGLYRYRILQVKKQQQIRKDIAGDLHDDIGSTLQALKVFTHLAKKEPHEPKHMDLAEESLTQVTLSLRDIIWVLDDSHDTLFDLMQRIKKIASPLAQAKGIHLECSVTGDPTGKNLGKTEKRNLLLIAKESINNSVKYAECKSIVVVLHQHKKNRSLVIKDDGIGFDPSVNSEGNGLRNIHYRAMQIRYHARIISSPGNGSITEIIKK